MPSSTGDNHACYSPALGCAPPALGSPVTPDTAVAPSCDAGLRLLCLAASGPSSSGSHYMHTGTRHSHAHSLPNPHAQYAEQLACAHYAPYPHQIAYAHPPHAYAARAVPVALSAPQYMPYAVAYAPQLPPSPGMLPRTDAVVYAEPAACTPPPPPVAKVKGPWRPEEDKMLTELVAKFGARRWTAIAAHVPGRTGKQARERWLNQLSPDLAKRAWSAEEDRVVMDAHARLGNRWSEIAKLLKGRTDNAVKNRFNTTIRRQIAEIAGVPREARLARRVERVPTSDTDKAASSASDVTDDSGARAHTHALPLLRKRKLEIGMDGAPLLAPVAQRPKVLAVSAQ